jgi:hypothetical protein
VLAQAAAREAKKASHLLDESNRHRGHLRAREEKTLRAAGAFFLSSFLLLIDCLLCRAIESGRSEAKGIK